MKVLVSKVIKELYQKNHKNYEYALESVINGFDPECYESAIKDVVEIKVNSEKVEVEVPDSAIHSIKELLGIDEVKTETIELLLWVAVLFPEI